jgi:APA family basic amino acid/polyamine antiporter
VYASMSRNKKEAKLGKPITKKVELKRTLGVGLSTIFSMGLILGATIYVMIGGAVAATGGLTWLVLCVGPAILYLFIGLTYAEFSSIYPSAASAYVYVREGLSTRSKRVANFISFIMLFAGLFVAIPLAAAVVALGSGYYLNSLLGLPPITIGGYTIMQPHTFIAILLVLVLSLLNWWGIKESAATMVITTIIEVAGLITIVVLGFVAGTINVNYFSTAGAPNPTILGFIGTFAIGYFLYTGFELIPSLAEEAKEPEKTVPRAILLSLTLITLLYALVSFGIVRLLPFAALASSPTPMIGAAAAVLGIATATLLFAFYGVFAGLNTVLAELVTGSRLMYGIAGQGALPRPLSKVSESRRTPTNAIIAIMLISVVFCLFEQIQRVLNAAAVTICMIDFTVCIALIYSRRRDTKLSRSFKVPLSVRRVPIPTVLAMISVMVLSLLLGVNDLLDPTIGYPLSWLPFLLMLPIGTIVYKYLGRKRK